MFSPFKMIFLFVAALFFSSFNAVAQQPDDGRFDWYYQFERYYVDCSTTFTYASIEQSCAGYVPNNSNAVTYKLDPVRTYNGIAFCNGSQSMQEFKVVACYLGTCAYGSDGEGGCKSAPEPICVPPDTLVNGDCAPPQCPTGQINQGTINGYPVCRPQCPEGEYYGAVNGIPGCYGGVPDCTSGGFYGAVNGVWGFWGSSSGSVGAVGSGGAGGAASVACTGSAAPAVSPWWVGGAALSPHICAA